MANRQKKLTKQQQQAAKVIGAAVGTLGVALLQSLFTNGIKATEIYQVKKHGGREIEDIDFEEIKD